MSLTPSYNLLNFCERLRGCASRIQLCDALVFTDSRGARILFISGSNMCSARLFAPRFHAVYWHGSVSEDHRILVALWRLARIIFDAFRDEDNRLNA